MSHALEAVVGQVRTVVCVILKVLEFSLRTTFSKGGIEKPLVTHLRRSLTM